MGEAFSEGYRVVPAGTTGYRGLRESAAWMDLSARGKIRMTGEDRVRLLHAMTTQNIQQLAVGSGAYTFFLNSQGRILGDANVFRFDDSLLLDTEPETRQKLYEHIDRYIIADDVTVEDATERTATVAIEGPASAEVLRKLGAPVPESGYAMAAWGARTIVSVSFTGAAGYCIFLPAAEKADLAAALAAAGVPEATPRDERTVRIEHGRPRYGEEITERYLVQETGQLHAVHFAKGCYLGQEIVERVRSQAQIHRLLRRLEIDTKTPPELGAKLTSGDAAAGEIASAVFSPSSGKVVALAYVRVPFAEPGNELTVDGARARVVPAG